MTSDSVERVIGRDWSAEFNALPTEIRTIGAAMEARLRIQHLRMEKMRLNKRHRQSMAEVNDHIKNCERWLRDLEKTPIPAAPQPEPVQKGVGQ